MDYPVKTPSQLGPLLVGFRKASGLTQADMALRLGVTQQTYAQLEGKPESASMDRLFKVLRLLNVDMTLTSPIESAAVASQRKRRAPTVAKTPVITNAKATRKRMTGAVETKQDIKAKIASGSSKGPADKRQASPPLAVSRKAREEW